jgi:hypothetical protein
MTTTPDSPYVNLPPERWKEKTRELIDLHPLEPSRIVDVVLSSWDSIFDSTIGTKRFAIGQHIFPKPHIMGFLLHELIPLEFQAAHPALWRLDRTGDEKDLVHIPDPRFSVEIKTSSHRSQIFGNRSYAQPGAASRKSKAGYYLTVNFERFSGISTRPSLRAIRFGWLDHSDWIAQRAATGQQARLKPIVYETKLLLLYGPRPPHPTANSRD